MGNLALDSFLVAGSLLRKSLGEFRILLGFSVLLDSESEIPSFLSYESLRDMMIPEEVVEPVLSRSLFLLSPFIGFFLGESNELFGMTISVSAFEIQGFVRIRDLCLGDGAKN